MELSPVQSLFLNNKFSDVAFIVEKREIPAHKNLLAAYCPYFETMLFGATNESKMTTIEVKNVAYKIFLEVLRVIYHQKVDINGWSAEEVKSLIQIADEYQFLLLAQFVAETLTENQIIVDTVDDIYGVGKRLNCGPVSLKCEEFVQRNQVFLLSNEGAFNKLSMDLIEHLMDKNVFDSTDEKLLYSITNWRNTGSITEKKTLLSKLDWKQLPSEYSEPLIRTLLQRGDSGLNVKNWCKRVKAPACNSTKVAAVYNSLDNQFLEASVLQSFLAEGCPVLNYTTRSSHLMIHFRDPICDIVRITFNFGPPAQVMQNYGATSACISLTVFGRSGVLQGKLESQGSITVPFFEFSLPKKADILVMCILFQDSNYEFYDLNPHDNHVKIRNIEFHKI